MLASDIRLDGRVAIVTGAAAGLGRAMAQAMVRAGANVVFADINAGATGGAVAEVAFREGCGKAIGMPCDITRKEDCERTVAETLRLFGGLHILVNNAGKGPAHLEAAPGTKSLRFWEADPDVWRLIIETNVVGAFFMSRAAVKPMLAQKWGRIISVTTSLDTMYRKGNAPYGPSKAGHEALVATMGQELEGTGVTANVLTPGGGTNTNLIPKSTPDTYRNALIKPEVMRAPAVWLASGESDGFNGQRIIAARWDEKLPIQERLEKAAAPAAWPQLGAQSVRPANN